MKKHFLSLTLASSMMTIVVAQIPQPISQASYYFDQAMIQPIFSLKRQLYLDSAILADPANPYYWQQKAMPLFKQKKYELGMTYLNKAVLHDTTDHWLAYRAFIKCIFQKSYKESILDFEKLQLKNYDGNVMDQNYNFYLGLCYLQLNQFEQSRMKIQESIDLRMRRWKTAHHLEYCIYGIRTG